ncbi:hypothetical protein [Nostoc sp.]|uniref:hypothetical protein n=1 Tax=Nostoc sp. TaxID=1180 RepID=UPI002FFD45B2
MSNKACYAKSSHPTSNETLLSNEYKRLASHQLIPRENDEQIITSGVQKTGVTFFEKGSTSSLRNWYFQSKIIGHSLQRTESVLCDNEVFQPYSQSSSPIQRLINQLDENSERRHQELKAYLDKLRPQANSTGIDGFTISVLDTAWLTWEKLKEYFLSKGLPLEVPDACPGKSNNFMYAWSKGEHYLECEILGNKELEFFYQNRNTSEVWGEDTSLEQEFSAAVLEKVALFAW